MQVLKNYPKIILPTHSDIPLVQSPSGYLKLSDTPSHLVVFLSNALQIKILIKRYYEVCQLLNINNSLRDYLNINFNTSIDQLRNIINDNIDSSYITKRISLIVESVIDVSSSFKKRRNLLLAEGYSKDQATKAAFLDTLTEFKSNVKNIYSLVPNLYIEAELKKKYPRNQKIVNELMQYIHYNTD